MRALITGGGVAGTTAAMALQRAGWDATVYEAYDDSSGLDLGAYLTVAVNGLDALRAIDAHHLVTADGFPTGQMEFYSGTGKKLGAMAMGPTLDDGTVTHTLRRADLYRRLYEEALARGIEIEHRKRLVAAEEHSAGGVMAHFDDGSSAHGELLIGADGLHSATRKIIDPAAPTPRHTGLGNTGGFTRVPDLPAPPGAYQMVWGRDCFFGYTLSPDGEIWWFANPPSKTEIPPETLRSLTTSELRDRLVQLLSADRTPGARIVASTTADFKLFNQYDLPRVPHWRKGSMVIIGDAAHAVSPASGQGCSLAFEDAVTLGQCLRDADTVELALTHYEQLRRPRVERIVKWGSSMNNTKRQGIVGRAIRDLVLPLILKRAARPEEMSKMAWMFNHHIDWRAPAIA